MAIDANVLIFVANTSSKHHRTANDALSELLSSGEMVYLFLPAVIAFVRVSTHSRLFQEPLSLDRAISNIRRLSGLPNVILGLAQEEFLDTLAAVALPAKASGKLIHDAEIVALMKLHSVQRILTADRDFLRFEGIEVDLLGT